LRGFAELEMEEWHEMGKKNAEYARSRFARARIVAQVIREIEQLLPQPSIETVILPQTSSKPLSSREDVSIVQAEVG
jgi:hypothetical protein